MKYWTVEKLFGELAAILVRLENGRKDDAREMAEMIVGDTDYHARAFAEFVEEFAEDYPDMLADYDANLMIEKADFRQQMLATLLDMEADGSVEHKEEQ